MSETGMSPARITQTLVHGAQAPVVLGLLMANMLLLGAVLASQFYLSHEVHEAGTEIRLMQLQVQDQSAIMIREGLIKPGDLTKGPTSGSTTR